MLLILGGYVFEWTGFAGKTLWDWLDLLIVPLVLAVGGYLFTRSENRNAQMLADQRAQDSILQSYLSQMESLLLDRKLRYSQYSAEVRKLARARTLTVLEALNGGRKRSLLQFLCEAELVTGEHPVLSLYGADLDGACLARMRLLNARLNGAHLNGANLNGATLSVMHGTGETLLKAAQMGVEVGSLMKPISITSLTKAELKNASLRQANLAGVDLVWADLSGADLRGAKLTGVRLSGANLTGARVTDEQLEECISLSGATMPDGSKHG